MKLQAWLDKEKMSHDAFAGLVDHSLSGVGKWARGERVPRGKAMLTVQEITHGEVTLADFYSKEASAPPPQDHAT